MQIAIGLGISRGALRSSVTVVFGELTAVGAGDAPFFAADGDYGEFTVVSNVMTARVSPLTVGDTVVNGITITVVADTYSVATDAQRNAAMTAHAAGSSASTILHRDGDYSLSATTWTSIDNSGKVLTIKAENRRAATFLNTYADIDSSTYFVFDGMRFHRTENYITANGGPNGAGNTAFLSSNISTNNITFRNCAWEGEAISSATLNSDTPTYTTDGCPVPKTLDFSRSGENIVVEDCDFDYVWNVELSLRDGTTFQRNNIRHCWFDGIRLTGNNWTDGGTVTVDECLIYGAICTYEESLSVHWDGIQAVMEGGHTAVSNVARLIVRNTHILSGGLRNYGSDAQGINLSNAPIDTLHVDQSIVLCENELGIRKQGDMDAIVTNSVIAAYGSSTATPDLMHNAVNGHWTIFNTIVEGDFFEVAAASDIFTTEKINSATLADTSSLAGPLTPTTRAAALAAVVASGGLAGMGPVDGSGVLKSAVGVPYAAAAPTVTAVSGGLEVTRAVPSDLDGESVASYDLRYRVNTSGAAYTTEADIAASNESLTLSDATYAVETRAVTDDGVPGFWSAEATQTVTSSLVDFSATPTRTSPSSTSATAITDGWRWTVNAGVTAAISWPQTVTTSGGPWTFAFTIETDGAAETHIARVSDSSALGNNRGLNQTLSLTNGVPSAESLSVSANVNASHIGIRLANTSGATVTVDLTQIGLLVI